MTERDADRPRILAAVTEAMKVADGLFDPSFLDRVAAESGVDRAGIVERWGTGPSLVADRVSETALATPGWPDMDLLTHQSRRDVVAALVASLSTQLADDRVTRAALAQAITSPAVRTVWSEFVHEDLEQWAEVLRRSIPAPRVSPGRDTAALAVTVVAGQCYSRIIFGTATTTISDNDIIAIALVVLDSAP